MLVSEAFKKRVNVVVNPLNTASVVIFFKLRMLVPPVAEISYFLGVEQLYRLLVLKQPSAASPFIINMKISPSVSLVCEIKLCQLFFCKLAGGLCGQNGSVRGRAVNFINTVESKPLCNRLCLTLAERRQ